MLTRTATATNFGLLGSVNVDYTLLEIDKAFSSGEQEETDSVMHR